MNTIKKQLSKFTFAAVGLATFSVSSCSPSIVGQTPVLSEPPPQSTATRSIPVELPDSLSAKVPNEGGLIAVDVDGDRTREIVVTLPSFIAAYSLAEGKLWERSADLQITQKTEYEGLPGTHGPGIQAADVDQDGAIELLFINADSEMVVLDGASGELKTRVLLPPINSQFGRWEHGIIANFSGDGDRDLLLQASQPTDKADYIRDSIQAAFSLSNLLSKGEEATPLWQVDNFVSLSHSPAKVIDLNQDGKDEVVGVTILGSDGETLYQADIDNTSFPHIDSIAVDDIDPQRPGLEVVIPEENGQERVILFDEAGEIWRDRHRSRSNDEDGDKVAIGNFDPDAPGLEMWFRGNRSAHFTVLSAQGDLIADYRFENVKTETWTDKGFEVINRIQWTGEEKEYIVAKERHEAGDVGLFDAMTGQLIAQFPAKTERLYVADILGDWREEIIILESDKLQIIENTAPNPNPNKPRLWEQPHYRRQKMTWNYYSP